MFEPNAPTLWGSITLEVTAFMGGPVRGRSIRGLQCGTGIHGGVQLEHHLPAGHVSGIVNVNVGFAPVDPAEFVMLNVQINAASAAS